MGKGSKRRVEDRRLIDFNWDRIFGLNREIAQAANEQLRIVAPQDDRKHDGELD